MISDWTDYVWINCEKQSILLRSTKRVKILLFLRKKLCIYWNRFNRVQLVYIVSSIELVRPKLLSENPPCYSISKFIQLEEFDVSSFNMYHYYQDNQKVI